MMAQFGRGAAADGVLMGRRPIDEESLCSLTTIQTQEGVTSIAIADGAIFELTKFFNRFC
jgi:hypothetical protein